MYQTFRTPQFRAPYTYVCAQIENIDGRDTGSKDPRRYLPFPNTPENWLDLWASQREKTHSLHLYYSDLFLKRIIAFFANTIRDRCFSIQEWLYHSTITSAHIPCIPPQKVVFYAINVEHDSLLLMKSQMGGRATL